MENAEGPHLTELGPAAQGASEPKGTLQPGFTVLMLQRCQIIISRFEEREPTRNHTSLSPGCKLCLEPHHTLKPPG